MILKFFDELEIPKDGSDLSPKAKSILDRFQARASAYAALSGRQMNLETFVDYQREYQHWLPRWQAFTARRHSHKIEEKNRQPLIQFLNEGQALLSQFEPKYASLIVDLGDVSSTFDEVSKQVAQNVRELIAPVVLGMTKEIRKEVESVREMKAELELGKGFVDTIKEQKEDAEKSSDRLFKAFLSSLLLLMLVLAVPTFLTKWLPDIWHRIALRVSMGIPSGFLVHFFFSQYKLQRVLFLKYRHLENFLRGGVSSLRQLLAGDPNLQADFHRRLMEMLLDIDQEIDATRSLKEPSLLSVKEALEVAREASSTARQIASEGRPKIED